MKKVVAAYSRVSSHPFHLKAVLNCLTSVLQYNSIHEYNGIIYNHVRCLPEFCLLLYILTSPVNMGKATLRMYVMAGVIIWAVSQYSVEMGDKYILNFPFLVFSSFALFIFGGFTVWLRRNDRRFWLSADGSIVCANVVYLLCRIYGIMRYGINDRKFWELHTYLNIFVMFVYIFTFLRMTEFKFFTRRSVVAE